MTNYIVRPKNHVVNFMCLILKQYIYRQRCFKKPLSFEELKMEFQRTENIEKYIAQKNDKMYRHEFKWNRKSENEPRTGYIREYVDGI